MKTIRGSVFFYSETGTEGGWFAVQDEKNIHADPSMPRGIRWDYEGNNLLADGDHLKIFKPDGTVYWEGDIKLKHYKLFTEHVFSLWIHADQEGEEREFWAFPFFHEYKAELTKRVI